MSFRNNYYFNSFFWSTFQKILNAIIGFISVPLLLEYFGKDMYGILSLAIACNGYMNILDLGMNVGAVRYFSIWKTENKMNLVFRVARTNLTFYTIIAIINALALVLIAIFGENWFSTTTEQFRQLQYCLFIIAGLSVFSWGTTTFHQLLVANNQMPFTSQLACLMSIGKILLVVVTLTCKLSLITYFFWLTALTASLLFPYAAKCKNDGMINSFLPATYWGDFKVVMMFSLSIFALSLFQMSATQTRPIILGLFSIQGPSVIAEFRILEVIPSMIIMIGGTFSSIFLPKTSEMVTRRNQNEISHFAYKWTLLTTIATNFLCFPFIVGASEAIGAYVGSQYTYLYIWLVIWLLCILCQVHSTPTNALILAYGKTKVMVFVSGFACVISMAINASLASYYGVGSAIIGYSVYIAITFVSYYFYYYKKILNISISSILYAFLYPTFWGTSSYLITWYICSDINCSFYDQNRLNYIMSFIMKAGLWSIIFVLLLFLFKVVRVEEKKLLTKFDL